VTYEIERKLHFRLDFLGDSAILFLVMRDNERAIREGIRKRAEKGGDMSVFSVLPWLKRSQFPRHHRILTGKKLEKSRF
jgi:hypothetical protein